jgi:putative ABC transport system permease protein
MEIGPVLRALVRNKTRFGLISLEIALTLAIVANCVSMIRDARREITHPSGFDDENLLSVRSSPFAPAFREDGYLDNSLKEDLAALRTLPGVRAVSNTRFLPWQGGGSSTEMRPAGSKGEKLRTQIYNCDEAILDTLGIRIVEGQSLSRDQVETDSRRLRDLLASNREVGADGTPREKFLQDVMVSQAFARLAFGEGKALGQLLEDSDGDQYRIVGVFDRFYNPYGWPIHEYAVLYGSWNRSYEGGTPYLLRVEPGRIADVARAAEEKLRAVNPGRDINVRTIGEVKDKFFAGQQLVVRMMGAMALLLVLVTSLGIVGLTSFSVTERTRQIGTRRALGARKADIVRHFLLENWLVTTAGLGAGAALAYGLNMGLVSGIGAARLESGMLLAGMLLLWSAGLLATLFPALRAARISPAIATRNV